ncbi:MAG: hypothetical protein ACLR5K_12805 [Acutalibacteraceae bacterium]
MKKSLEKIYFLRLFERTSIKRRYPLLYSSQKRNTPGITVIIGVKIRYPPSARDEKKKIDIIRLVIPPRKIQKILILRLDKKNKSEQQGYQHPG